jgi:tetratricopeptide (TPR) repeat protein
MNRAYRCVLRACLCIILTFLAQLCLAEAATQASLSEVQERIQRGDFKGASELASTGLKLHPEEAQLWNLLGIAQGELGEYQASEDAFRRGLHVAPSSATLEENLGLIFFKQSKYPAAKEHLTRAVRLGSQKPGVRFSLAASRLRTGEAAEGLADLKSLESALGDLSEYWEERGFAELKIDPKTAASSFHRALDIRPESVRALNGAASAAEQQGSDEEALAYLTRARSKSPEDVPTLMHLAVVCLRRGLGPDALTALNKAHTLQPENNSALYLLARANVAVQNWDGALEQFQDFARKAPQYPVTVLRHGLVGTQNRASR